MKKSRVIGLILVAPVAILLAIVVLQPFDIGDATVRLRPRSEAKAFLASLRLPIGATDVVSSISFAVNYLHRERGFHRFFLLMSLFNGAMLLLLTAGNAVLTFIGWELAGVSSYLLIGDTGFILAIARCWQWVGGVEWSQLAGGTQTQNAGLFASGFLLAAMTKSAQAPFSPWITRALEGPTPSSALS